MRRRIFVLFFIVVATLLAASAASARPSLTDINTALREADRMGSVVVIVDVQTPPVSFGVSEATSIHNARARVIDGVKRGKIRITDREFNVLREHKRRAGFIARVDRAGIQALANTPGVTSIVSDKIFRLDLADSVPLIRANDAWNRTIANTSINGMGQTICVIDTGVDHAHPAFAGRILPGKCFLASGCPDGDENNASDDNNHGTHVAGIALANGTSVGVAPAANLLPIKACDSAGNCYLSAMTSGLDYCINMSAQHNISVITLSISDGGHYNTIDDCPWDATFEGLVNSAYAQGITVSMASGNAGGVGIAYPACIPNATSVAATDKSDVIAGYSQTGALLDILAPGSSITSTVRGGYGVKSGTSMATPHIAGAAALLAQNERLHGRTITPNLLEDLMKTYSSKTVSNWSRINVIEVLTARNTGVRVNSTNSSVTLPGVGAINFLNATEMRNIDLCLNISANNITINSTRCPELNKSATLRLDNISLVGPAPYRDGQHCTDCTGAVFANNTFTFTVPRFSSYTAGVNSQLLISDDTDTLVRVPHQTVLIGANYSNISTGTAFADALCTVQYNITGVYGDTSNLTFDAGTQQYTTTTTFNSTGTFPYDITCNATGAEPLNTTDSVVITADTTAPVILLISPDNATTITTSNYVRFIANTTDDSGALANCTVILNGADNTTALLPPVGINASINITINNSDYNWSIRCTDRSGQTNTSETRTLTLNVGNSAPALITPFNNISVAEDTATTIELASHYNDSNGDPLTYTAVHNASLLVTIDNAAGNATLIGAANVSGTFTLSFTAHDPLGATAASNDIIVTITPVNDPPVFSGTISSQSWNKGSSKDDAFYLDDHFSDIDNATLSYSSNGTSAITVTIDSTTGRVSFSQSSNYTGTEYVTFNATDGQYSKTSNTVTLTVNNVTSTSSGSGGGGGGGGACSDACAPANTTYGCGSPIALLKCLDNNNDGCLEFVNVECGGNLQCINKQCVAPPCVPAWSCTDWGTCTGQQTRTCTDLMTCNSTQGKPAETQTCTPPPQPVAALARPAAPEMLAVAEPPATNGTSGLTSMATSNATCGDGQCAWNEWCSKDCKPRNIKAVFVTIFLLGIVTVVTNHLLRLRKQ